MGVKEEFTSNDVLFFPIILLGNSIGITLVNREFSFSNLSSYLQAKNISFPWLLLWWVFRDLFITVLPNGISRQKTQNWKLWF